MKPSDGGFEAIEGQQPAVQTLLSALARGRVHHAYRFEGPDGVGKERTAFALAQALLCEKRGPVACRACSPCRRAVTLSDEPPHVPLHPDLVLVGRGLYAGTLGASEATGISVDQIRRVVLGRAGYTPHEGRALVFIVRDAEELTSQAANALLKTLEEPGPSTHFVLLTSRPSRLLDTIRSRTLAVRFGPLPETVVASILERHGKPTAAAALAQGSASLALTLADEASRAEREQFAEAALAAVRAPDLTAGLKFAESRPPERDQLRQQLGFLAQYVALEARRSIASEPRAAERAARQHRCVLEALGEVERNGQPQLVLETMIARMRAV